MRRIGMRLVIAASIIMLAQACVSTGSSNGIRRDPDLIVAEELANHSTMMLLDAIRQLRPRWINLRSIPQSVVVDGGAAQSKAILETLGADQVRWVRFHSPADATMRWGIGFQNGLIEVSTMGSGGGG
ncbi:MAG: hypothetical protein OXN92_06155 [Gammaproteobacteria bacterium]|nr:hypothetical protein [Gammaproteobacteria bacterium]